MREPIRTAGALDIDARLSAAKPRPQSFDWVMVLQEARDLLIFAAVAGGVVYACLSIGGV